MSDRAKSWRDVFNRLDRWRNLPKYQLERRADIFFSLYLLDIMQSELGKRRQKFIDLIIPEFPLLQPGSKSKGTGKKCHLSNNVDYLMFSEPRGKTPESKKVWLVELKTDGASIRPEQIDYICQAARQGLGKCVKDLVEIALNTNSRQKYFHLLHSLSSAGIILSPTELRASTFNRTGSDKSLVKSDSRYCGLVEKIKLAPEWRKAEAEIVFIVPEEVQVSCKGRHLNVRCITFNQISRFLRTQKGELPRVFARSLNHWHDVKAGFDEEMLT